MSNEESEVEIRHYLLFFSRNLHHFCRERSWPFRKQNCIRHILPYTKITTPATGLWDRLRAWCIHLRQYRI